jgi:hypothetical protein
MEKPFIVENVSLAVFTQLAAMATTSVPAGEPPVEVETVSPTKSAATLTSHGVTARAEYDSEKQILAVAVIKHPFWLTMGFIQHEFTAKVAEISAATDPAPAAKKSK